MTRYTQSAPPGFAPRQRGMVLLVSLVFLLLLTMLGISSMQSATLQEKMAGSVTVRNTSFQRAEAALRLGETAIRAQGFTMARCSSPIRCAPPAESTTLVATGLNNTSGVEWRGTVDTGFFGIQNLGTTATPVLRPATCIGPVTLYRVTAVAIQDATRNSQRTVLESIYANC